MAANGPSQRKTSVSTLVYATLGPSLGLLPTEEKGSDWVVVGAEDLEGSTPKDQEPNVDSASRPHAQRTSVTSVNDTESEPILEEETNEANKPKSDDSTGRVLSRLYSSPATSGLGQKNRLAFTSKSGAGSISTMEQATLPEKSSIPEDGALLSPMSPVTKQLQGHISTEMSTK